jgi:hypothetical protein
MPSEMIVLILVILAMGSLAFVISQRNKQK